MKSANDTVVGSSGSERVLVIMAKAPRPGAVKTPLTPSLSPEAVTAFYCCLLDDTLTLARSLGEVEVAILCPEPDVGELARLAGNEVNVVAQEGEGLAAGLTSVFAHFAEGHQRRTIAFDSDSPLSVGFSDLFYDIDVADDLTCLAAELRLAPIRAPRTAQKLEEWELVAAQSRTGTEES